jgi:hypothetical protein
MDQLNRKLTFIALALITMLTMASSSEAQRREGESTAAKGGKPRILVVGAGGNNTSWTMNVTTATLEDAITQSGRFEVIAGAQRDKILKEQGFSSSDLVDPKNATAVGKLLTARYIIIGNALDVTMSKKRNPLGGVMGMSNELGADVKSKVQIQMIDAETGVLKLSKSYEQKASSNSAMSNQSDSDKLSEGYRKAMETIATQFVGEFGASVPTEGLVVLVKGGRVALDLGSDQVKVGQEFEVYSQDEPIRNAAGEVLSYETTKYARLRITEVEDKLSWATVLTTFDENGAADAQVKIERIKRNLSARKAK